MYTWPRRQFWLHIQGQLCERRGLDIPNNPDYISMEKPELLPEIVDGDLGEFVLGQ